MLVIAPLTPKRIIRRKQLKPARYVLYVIKIKPTGTRYTVNEQIPKISKKQVYENNLVKKYENDANSEPEYKQRL